MEDLSIPLTENSENNMKASYLNTFYPRNFGLVLILLCYPPRMDGEMHLVHLNSKYADAAAALAQPDGVAVLGFFFKRSARKGQKSFQVRLIVYRQHSII